MLPTDVVIADAFSADAAVQIVGADGILGRLAGPGHRAGERGELLRGRRGRGHRVLERPDGRVRARARSPTAPGRSPRRSPPRRRSRWSAAATRRRRCASSASTNPASPTSRPAVARPWSSSRAKSSPAWPFWRHDADEHPQAADRRQLEDEPHPPRGHRAGPEDRVHPAGEVPRARRGGGHSAVHRAALGADADRGRQARNRLTARRTCPPHDSGAYTGEISGIQLAKLGLHLRAGRSLGAPRVPRRVGRAAGEEGQRRLQARADPAAVRRRGPGGPGGRQPGRSTRWTRCWPRWPT